MMVLTEFLSLVKASPFFTRQFLNQGTFSARSEHTLDDKSSDEVISIDEKKVRRALIRAYMKGERSAEIDIKQFIQDLANDIKGFPTT